MSYAQGIAALRAGDLSTAERLLLAVVDQDQTEHAAWHALSVIALRAGMPDIAIERGRRAVLLSRRNADYLNSLGVAHAENRQYAAAEQAFRRALTIKPAHGQAHYNLGTALRKQAKLPEALREYERAHALEPTSAAILLDLAQLCRVQGQSARALSFLRSVGHELLDPDLITLRAECMVDVENADAAVSWLREVITRHPDCQAAHYALAVLLLALGHWREGWKHHLWRASGERRRASLPDDRLPERLQERRIVLRAEQGLGDVLFFLRFAPELRDRGAEVVLDCPPQLAKLRPLVADHFPIAEPTLSDLQIWIADLPSLLETEATPPALTLRTDRNRSVEARERLAAAGPPPYLGVTWRAGTDVRHARSGIQPVARRKLFKEISPALMGGVVREWPGTLISLQREPASEELVALRQSAEAEVQDMAAVNQDLPLTLAVLEQLHSYVAVSNTNIHLLAGLGRTAHVLVPYPPEWRWMRTATFSAWFPSFPVYRQSAAFDWGVALARLRQALFSAKNK